MSKKNNWSGWNERLLSEKMEKNHIRGFRASERHQKERKNKEGGKIITKHFGRKNKALDYIAWNLWYWCNERALQLQEEYQFSKERKFRFDFAIPAVKIAVEFEGGIRGNIGGHTSGRGVKRDIEKYDMATQDGWTIIRLHAENYEELLNKLNFWYEKNLKQ